MKKASRLEKQQFVDRLLMLGFMSSIGSGGGVGHHTKKIKGRDKEVMEQLTSKDFERPIK